MRIFGLNISKANSATSKRSSKGISRGKHAPSDDLWAFVRHNRDDINQLKQLAGDLRRDVWRVEKATQSAKKSSVKSILSELAPQSPAQQPGNGQPHLVDVGGVLMKVGG